MSERESRRQDGDWPTPLAASKDLVCRPSTGAGSEPADSHQQLAALRARLAGLLELLAACQWAEKQLRSLVTEDDGTGVFIRGTGVELAGFGAGVSALRAAIAKAVKVSRCPARTDIFGRCELLVGHDGLHRNAMGDHFSRHAERQVYVVKPADSHQQIAALRVRLEGLVQQWRQQAHAWNNREPMDHRAAQVYRQSADDLAAVLAEGDTTHG